jgi:large subunit ribosomal protein L1
MKSKQHGKKFLDLLKKYDSNSKYSLSEAIDLVKKLVFVNFDSSVDLAVKLNLNPKQADQNLKGAAVLPNGLGKKINIVVFAKGEKAVEASSLSVLEVGDKDLIDKIKSGWIDFDTAVATPDMMGEVSKLGKVLGPRGLMPNPKLGTVTFDLTKCINDLNKGKSEFKLDKAGIVHTSVGKASFKENALIENINAVLDALIKLKPSSAKGNYIKTLSISSTMGPGIKIDINSLQLF